MAKVPFSKLNLKFDKDDKTIININGIEVEVLKYLPQAQKSELVEYILDNALDERSFTFSPIRLETYTSLGIVKFYTNINFTEKQLADAAKTYDLLEATGTLLEILGAIPEEEYEYINHIVEDTAKDMSRHFNSFAGMINNISDEAVSFDEQLNIILEKIKNKEGIETLSAIKDING